LLAPTSGGETRKFLRHKADEGTDFIKRQGRSARLGVRVCGERPHRHKQAA
jgi:gas vesicle protein